MRNLLRRLLTQHRSMLILISLLFGFFQFILCAVVASLNLESALDQLLLFAPPAVRAVIEQTMLGGSAAGVLAFGWNHPITHALLAVVAITFGSRAIAGEIENGAIELVLAQPISRIRYFMAQLLFALLAIGLAAGAGVLGTAIGERVYSLNVFHPMQLFELFIGTVLLQAAILGLALLVSSLGREAGRVAFVAVWLTLVSYLVNVLAGLWNRAAFLKPYSLHSYYDPRKLLVGGSLPATSLLVLFSFAVVTSACAFARFRARDLP